MPTAINSPDRGAVTFQFDVPLAPLKPGNYVCQVNVIDDAGGSFSFPRLALSGSPNRRVLFHRLLWRRRRHRPPLQHSDERGQLTALICEAEEDAWHSS